MSYAVSSKNRILGVQTYNPKRKKKSYSKRTSTGFTNKIKYLLFSIVFLSALILIGTKIYAFVYRTPYFTVKRIRIEGNKMLGTKNIEAMVSDRTGKNILKIDLKSVEEKLNSIPQVARAEVIREFPATIRVIVAERYPVAFISVKKQLMGIDRSGKIFPLVDNYRKLDLPVITGISETILNDQKEISPELETVLRFIQLVPASILEKVSEIHIAHDKTLHLYLMRGGRHIVLSAERNEMEKNISRLRKLREINSINRLSDNATLDLRYKDIVVR